MGPLVTNYHDETARKQRRGRSLTENEGPTSNEAVKANEEDGRRQRGGSVHGRHGDDEEPISALEGERRRYN